MGSQLPVPADRHCNARKRQGEGLCAQRAGWGTDHPGEGRCKLHGGCNPIKHGYYSTVTHQPIRELLDKHAETEKAVALDMRGELALARAVLEAMLAKVGDGLLLTGAMADLLMRMVSEVTRIIKRIEDIRTSRATIPAAQVDQLMREMCGRFNAVIDRRIGNRGRDVLAEELEAFARLIKSEVSELWDEIEV